MVDSSLTYYMNGSGIVTSLTVNFNGTANDLERSKQLFESTIAPLISLASSLPDDAQKVKLVHDYLTNTIQYEPEYDEPAYDFDYIDEWSNEDWDSYLDDLDNWLYGKGYDDIDYDNYDDWEEYYFGEDIDDWYDDFDFFDYYNDY